MFFDAEPWVHWSMCLCQKSAFFKTVVCDFDLWTYDLENIISVMWTW